MYPVMHLLKIISFDFNFCPSKCPDAHSTPTNATYVIPWQSYYLILLLQLFPFPQTPSLLITSADALQPVAGVRQRLVMRMWLYLSSCTPTPTPKQVFWTKNPNTKCLFCLLSQPFTCMSTLCLLQYVCWQWCQCLNNLLTPRHYNLPDIVGILSLYH